MNGQTEDMRRGILFVVSAPSGTGKTTLVQRLVTQVPDIVMSRSYTSRPARAGEVDGVDYNFISARRFAEMVEADSFLEWATVFGYQYGTGAADTDAHQRAGRDVVLVIDVQGAAQVRGRAVDAVSIFVMPPSYQELERRLRGRSGLDTTAEQLQRRLDTARAEVEARTAYDYGVVNDSLERCVDLLRCIVVAERARMAAVGDRMRDIALNFSE